MARLGLAAAVLGVLAAGIYAVLKLDSGRAQQDGTEHNAPRPEVAADSAPDPQAGAAGLAQANNRFALELYRQLKAEPGNLFFSPWSIESVLAMAHEGAGGQTASEMEAVGHFGADAAPRRSAFAALHGALNSAEAEYQLSTANALWVQQAYPLKPAYSQAVEQFYGGKASNLDFGGQTEQARQTINAWVEERTHDRIKELFGRGALTPLTRLVLTDAIYFKGKWENEFAPERTYPEPFHLTPEAQTEVQMMHLAENEAWVPYAASPEWQAVKLPYKGSSLARLVEEPDDSLQPGDVPDWFAESDLSMLVILPQKSLTLQAFEDSLTPQKWEDVRQALQQQQVIVQLPRFKFDTRYTLNPFLQALGMRQAFAPGADFSGMADTGELYIDLVIHQAFIEVNEEGTEAAAATGMAAAGSAAPPNQPPLFRADRPFLFAITHDKSGAILFMGRVADPTR